MKHLYILGLLLAAAPSGTRCAGDPPNARSLGMASVTLVTGPGPGTTDPASLSLVKVGLAGIHVTEPYGMPELGRYGLSACLPAAGGAFGISCFVSGTTAFRWYQGSLAFGKSLGFIRAGVRIRAVVLHQTGIFGSAVAIIPALAIQADPLPALTLGVEIDNPAGQGFYPATAGRLPVGCRVALAIRAGDEILFCFELEKESQRRTVFRTGLEATPNPLICIRFGITTAPEQQFALGIGLKLSHLGVDFAASHHPILGYTPSLSLVRSLRKPVVK